MNKISSVFALSLISLSSSCFAQQTKIITDIDISNIKDNASPELRSEINSNPTLLPQLVNRINLAYNVAKNDSNPALTASSMVGSFISSNQYNYNMPESENQLDCSAMLAASTSAAQDALNAISDFNLNNYDPEKNKPAWSKYSSQDIIRGIMQGTMAAGLAGITADQISIGTYQVCNNNSLKALSYMTTMTNLTTSLFSQTLKNQNS